MKTGDRIVQILTNNTPQSFNELKTALNVSYDSLRGAINRLLKAKLIQTQGLNVYTLPMLTRQPTFVPYPGQSVVINDPSKCINPTCKMCYPVTSVHPVAPPVVKPKLNRVMLVLDNSGSMSMISAAAQKAFNNTLRALKENAHKFGQRTLISRYLFGTEITVLDNQVDSNSVQFMSNYTPNEGHTRLFDAVGQAIDDHANLDKYDTTYDVSYLLIVVTDGKDNRAYRYNANSLATLMSTVQKTDRWTITFQLPPNGKNYFLRCFPSIPAGNVIEWEQTERGVETVARETVAGVGSYFASRSVGETFTKGFYTVNANDISSKDLTKLNNVQNLTKSWTCEKESEIADFSKSKLGFYAAGTMYYQLTKDEKVQSYKKILVQKRFSKQVYAGQEARDLLSLPSGDIKVRVGNLGEYDVFIQSTSVNRKLVRGSKVIYYPGVYLCPTCGPGGDCLKASDDNSETR